MHSEVFFGPLNMHTKNRLLHAKFDFASRSERPVHAKQIYPDKKWNGPFCDSYFHKLFDSFRAPTMIFTYFMGFMGFQFEIIGNLWVTCLYFFKLLVNYG